MITTASSTPSQGLVTTCRIYFSFSLTLFYLFCLQLSVFLQRGTIRVPTMTQCFELTFVKEHRLRSAYLQYILLKIATDAIITPLSSEESTYIGQGTPLAINGKWLPAGVNITNCSAAKCRYTHNREVEEWNNLFMVSIFNNLLLIIDLTFHCNRIFYFADNW